MRGPEGSAQALADHLAERLPAIVGDRDIVTPALFTTWHTPYGAIEPGQWPALNVNTLSLTPLTWDDHDAAGGPVTRVEYRHRIFLWVRGQGFEDVTRRRNDLAGLVTEAVIGWPKVDELTTLDPRSVRGSLSDVEQPDDLHGASIAAAYIDVVANVVETVEIDPLGTASTIEVDEHPGLA